MRYKSFVPKSIVCLHNEGYSWNVFLKDLFAGVSVGVIALPLALAFAIASGVAPEKGVYTAIIAGFLGALLSGSRVQIGGPTGTFVIVSYVIVQQHGYEGLALATFIGALILIVMGLARLGNLLKFIPYPVIAGFTTGMAVLIFSSQVKDFFGLQVDQIPPRFVEKCILYCKMAHTGGLWPSFIAIATLCLLFVLKHFFPRLPGAIVAVLLATLGAHFFELPVTTIEAKFGKLSQSLPVPTFPSISWELIYTLLPEGITIAFLGAIESLLSAVVADGMTGNQHRPNCELLAQGCANIGAALFQGIPSTGALARTTANVRLGAKTPVSGMIHSATLLLIMIFFSPLVGKIPLAALSAVLVFVAWNMSELSLFIEILKGQKGDAMVLLLTFSLTILANLAVAVEAGVLLASIIFLKRMADKTTVEVCPSSRQEDLNEDLAELKMQQDTSSDTAIFEITGPFFYGVTHLLDEALTRLPIKPRLFILRLNRAPLIDATGLQALKKFNKTCQQKGIAFLLSEVDPEQRQLLKCAGLEPLIGKESLLSKTSFVVA